MRTKVLVLLLSAFLVVGTGVSTLVAPVRAVSANCTLDKQSYGPGDTGTLTLLFQPEKDPTQHYITNVDFEISNMTVFHLVPSTQRAMLGLDSTGTTTYVFNFTVPNDAKLGKYNWTVTMAVHASVSLSFNGTLRIGAAGQSGQEFSIPWFVSPIIVILAVASLYAGSKYGKLRFTRRGGALMMGIAPVLFVLSLLFLANTVLHPATSLPYEAGQLLCFTVAPTILISGIFMLSTAGRGAKRAASPVVVPRFCPNCGRKLSELPTDINTCPYCGKTLDAEPLQP